MQTAGWLVFLPTVEQRIMGKISVSGWYLAILSLRAWQARMLALSSPDQLEQKD